MFKDLNLPSACMRICMLICMYISLYVCIKVHRHRTNFQSVSATPRQIFLLLYPSCRKQRENNNVPCSFTLSTFMNTRWHISLSHYTHSSYYMYKVSQHLLDITIYVYMLTYICINIYMHIYICIYIYIYIHTTHVYIEFSPSLLQSRVSCRIARYVGKSENARTCVITIRVAPPCFQARKTLQTFDSSRREKILPRDDIEACDRFLFPNKRRDTRQRRRLL